MNAKGKHILTFLGLAVIIAAWMSSTAVGEEFPLLLGQNTIEAAATGGDESASESSDEALSPECAEFAKDSEADVGDVIRAGCQPTLAQMSALMDNPLGNVAMLTNRMYSIMHEDGSKNGKISGAARLAIQ